MKLTARKALGGTILMLLVLMGAGLIYTSAAPVAGMDPTVEIGFTLAGLMFAALTFVLYLLAAGTGIGKKIVG